MRILQQNKVRIVAGALLAGGLAGASLFALPAAGLEGDEQPTDSTYADRYADDGSIIPEPESTAPEGQVVEDRDDLVAIERQQDPQGSASTYVCANIGDTSVTVVHERSAPKDAEPNPNAGPAVKPPDPCADKSMVVGN